MEMSVADLLAMQANVNSVIGKRRNNGYTSEQLDNLYLVRDDLRAEINRRYKSVFGFDDLFTIDRD